ncbi:hypothetical protein KO561_14265 [Radiobacillus kanasensis]|uniref:hypothetical protein n=1 Tax=Radiobacillus kanasensis TaxID=2844358 RepID=UPI001E580887|nr:hypothetical protein [Radiobacillus kanasensis]UFT98358.1 hypothetical protein KO561_14265 [Radiobacillus kanasensis]
MNSAETSLMEFTKFHDKFINSWNEAMVSGDTSAVELMDEEYYVAFFASVKEKPFFFNKDDAISGMKQSVQQFLGATKRFDHRVIRLKDNEHAIVFYEQAIEKDGQILSRLFTMENWQVVDNSWKLVREIEQPLGD